jgi:hypothetical protein
VYSDCTHNFFTIVGDFDHYYFPCQRDQLSLSSRIPGPVPVVIMSNDTKGSDKGGSSTTVKESAGSNGPVFF